MKFPLLICFIILNNAFSAEPVGETYFNKYGSDYEVKEGLGRIGDYGYPNNPQYDRAIGFLLKGEVKNAVSNNGNFITWDHHPSGLWRQYGYLPHIGFIAGVPGHTYSSEWSKAGYDSWTSEYISINGVTILIWKSNDAYNAWVEDVDDPLTEEGNFKTVVYNTIDDRGDIAVQKENISMLDTEGDAQWVIDYELELVYLFFDNPSLNPNSVGSLIGFAYPWAIRPAFKSRSEGSGGFYFDQYSYGVDLEEWTDDDEYVYFGATFAESWFKRDGGIKTDWQATSKARYNSHNLDNTAGELFGETDYTDPNDPNSLLAHSAYPGTWPSKYSFDTGEFEPFWPGWWADEYYGDSPETWSTVGIYDCNGTRADDGCWKPLKNRFISEMDVYMEFDDRWAHVGNNVLDNEYVSAGYPMGLQVMSSAHSYGVAYAEDVMFVTVKVRNESGDFCAFENDKNGFAIQVLDENGAVICEDGMVMPDGTKLNRGTGFDYQKLYLGFYMDADVLSTDANGGFGVHTNDDDFMQYIDCKVSTDVYPDGCPVVNEDTLRISMAVIGDYDGSSNAAKGYSMETDKSVGPDFGIVAIQLLDSPYSTGYVDLNQDGFIDIYPGEKLKMTDWHWFDWWDRPGVLSGEQASDTPAKNKELIQYQVMAGDNTNLTISEKDRYFHTPDPANDLDSELNPHFDSLEGLKQTQDFLDDPEGLDCVLEMSTGPFDLKVGEEVSFSFSIIFGANIEDLLQNAYFAQIMYNSHYQGYTPPVTPNVMAVTGHNKVELYWDDISIRSKDVITGYSDFEGFKIYRSLDGGNTWGAAGDEIFISDVSQGWQPLSIGCKDNPLDLDHASVCDSYSSKISCGYSDYSSFIKRDSDNDDIDDCIWKYAQFDLSSEADSSFCIYGMDSANSCVGGEVRGADVQGIDPMAQWLNLGYDTGLGSIFIDPENPDSVLVITDETSGEVINYKYKYVDYSVTDGVEYVYSVVAYDRGVPPEIISYIPLEGDTTFMQTVVSVPDPAGWGQINAFKILESPKGTTVHDLNFVKVVPGYTPEADLSKITVVPNPYIVHSNFNETQYKKKIRFTRLPEKCTITIFTVTGEKVRELHHDNSVDGNAWWDLRSYNNQEIAPGLYIYVVETPTGEKKIDKFAVVR